MKHNPVSANCPLSKYIHSLGAVGSLVDLSVPRAAQRLNVQAHTIHSEIRDLRILGIIQAETSNPGFYTVRILQ
jgi:hypothetical protein